jgi:hypothetical protein
MLFLQLKWGRDFCCETLIDVNTAQYYVFIIFHYLINEENLMSIDGYIDYKRREYCKDIKCPVQLDLDAQEEGSEEYERIRAICKNECIHTTYEFHHWLINKGYLVIRPGESD